MKKEVQLLIEKSKRSMGAAKVLFEREDYDFSASRAYYAMFYMAEAALLEKGHTYSKYAGVISGFFHYYVATGEVSKDLHQSFHRAFEDRHQGDYAYLDPFPKKEAKILLAQSEYFLKTIEKLLKKS